MVQFSRVVQLILAHDRSVRGGRGLKFANLAIFSRNFNILVSKWSICVEESGACYENKGSLGVSK